MFPEMVVSPNHPKMIIFSRKTPWLLGTTIFGNIHIDKTRKFLGKTVISMSFAILLNFIGLPGLAKAFSTWAFPRVVVGWRGRLTDHLANRQGFTTNGAFETT